MPTIDEAIERAARALCCGTNRCQFVQGGIPYSECQAKYRVPKAKAVLSAFLSDVPVSEGILDAGANCNGLEIEGNDECTIYPGIIFKAMSAKLAEEIQ